MRTRSAEKDQGSIRTLLIIFIVLLVGIAAGAITVGIQGEDAKQETSETKDDLAHSNAKAEQGTQLAEKQLDFCADPAFLRIKDARELCDLAVDVQTQQPPLQGKPGRDGKDAPAPTQEQVDAAVNRWFASNAGAAKTVENLVTVVGDYLRAHPPAPGKDAPPPTEEQIALAAASYISTHMEDFRGEPGDDGKDAPPPTGEEIQAQVRAFCAANGDCRGPKGDQGISIVSVSDPAVDEQGACVLLVHLVNPATKEEFDDPVRVPDSFCAPTTPPSLPPSLPPGG